MRGVSAAARVRACSAGEFGPAAGFTLTAAVLGFFMVALDAAIVNIALPAMRDSLGGGMAGTQWVVDGYTLMFAALLLSAGALTDRAGAFRSFRAGLAVFAVTSMVCGLAPNLGILVTARFVQGAAAAVVMPSSMAMVSEAYQDPARRTRALAVWAMGGGLATLAGPLLGGLLTLSSWRLIFFVNVPAVVVALVLVTRTAPVPRPTTPLSPLPMPVPLAAPVTRSTAPARRPTVPQPRPAIPATWSPVPRSSVPVPRSSVPVPRQAAPADRAASGQAPFIPPWLPPPPLPPARVAPARFTTARFDWAGQITGVVAMGGLTYGAIETGAHGFAAPDVITAFIVAVAALAAFLVIQARIAHPMVPPALLKSRAVPVAAAVGFAFIVGYYGLPFVMSLYLQQARGLSPLAAGVVFVPMMLTGAAGIPFTARAVQRLGAPVLIFAGLSTMAAGLVLLSLTGPGTPVWVLSALMILAGLAGPTVTGPMTGVLLNSVPRHQAGTASGIYNTSRQVGGALAVAVFGALLGRHTASLQRARASLLIAAFVALAAGAATCLLPRRAGARPTKAPAHALSRQARRTRAGRGDEASFRRPAG